MSEGTPEQVDCNYCYEKFDRDKLHEVGHAAPMLFCGKCLPFYKKNTPVDRRNRCVLIANGRRVN